MAGDAEDPEAELTGFPNEFSLKTWKGEPDFYAQINLGKNWKFSDEPRKRLYIKVLNLKAGIFIRIFGFLSWNLKLNIRKLRTQRKLIES